MKKEKPLVEYTSEEIKEMEEMGNEFVEALNSISANDFYTAEELAKALRVNIMTIYRYVKAGKIKAYKIGKDFRIDKQEFSKFLNSVKIK